MKHKQQTLGPTQRQLRVGEQLRHIAVETLARGHFHDPFLLNNHTMISISEVKVSPDMKYATAYVVLLGGGVLTTYLSTLEANADVFQKEFARQMRMKFTPKIRFAEDTSFGNSAKIDAILMSLPKPTDTK